MRSPTTLVNFARLVKPAGRKFPKWFLGSQDRRKPGVFSLPVKLEGRFNQLVKKVFQVVNRGGGRDWFQNPTIRSNKALPLDLE